MGPIAGALVLLAVLLGAAPVRAQSVTDPNLTVTGALYALGRVRAIRDPVR